LISFEFSVLALAFALCRIARARSNVDALGDGALRTANTHVTDAVRDRSINLSLQKKVSRN